MGQLILKYNDGNEHRVDRWSRKSLKYFNTYEEAKEYASKFTITNNWKEL